MQYIILDMEWNQPWPGSYSAKKALPSPMRGEIVQIGAVRMTQEQQIADEFQILIRPQYFKKMNRKVAHRHPRQFAPRKGCAFSRGRRAVCSVVRRGLRVFDVGL